MEEYRIATSAEKREAEVYEDYDLLIGPDGFQCALTEPEDRTFSRDLKPIVIELNRLRHLIAAAPELLAALKRLRDDVQTAHVGADERCKDCAVCWSLKLADAAIAKAEGRDVE